MKANYILPVIVIAVIISMFTFVGCAGAAPTVSVTNVTADTAYFEGTGSGSVGWFEWGSIDGYYPYGTINQTYTGTFEDYIYGPPMLTSSTYYVRACDNTGCGSPATFTTPSASKLSKTAYGLPLLKMMHSGMDIETVFIYMVRPYSDPMGNIGSTAVVWALLFLFIFMGMWIKPRDIFIPCILAMSAGGFIWLGSGPAFGMPTTFAVIGQGIMYAAIAGIVVSWFTK